MDIISWAFNDVKKKDLPEKPQGIGGSQYLDNISAMQVGYGSKVFRGDRSGIWLGASKFTDAPFSVDMEGNVIATSADFSGTGYTKINIFKQDGIPTSIAIGDLWFDTDDKNKLYRAGSVGADAIIAGEWEAVRDTDIAQALSDATTAQTTADSKIITFYQTTVPTATDAGDLWVDTNDGNKLYRSTAAGDNQITAGQWESVDDTRKTKVFAQAAIPTSLAIGDLWYDTDDGNKPYIAESVGADQIIAGKWVAVSDARAADALLKTGSSQTLSGDFIVGASGVKIDGANTRIVIHDGTTNRGVFGNV